MPRKAKKTAKPPLLFLEQPSCGSRLRAVPEVRAALNPKDFFTEETKGSRSALQTWVSPQFTRSVFAAPPARRGRRRCQSAASLLDGCTPSRKTSACKFPTLSFQTGPRDCQAQSSCAKKATRRAAEVGDEAKKTTASNPSTGRKRHEAQASRSRVSDQPGNEAAGRRGTPPDAPPPDAPPPPPGCVSPPPEVDASEVVQEEGRSPLHTSTRLLEQPLTPPGSRPPRTLAADTPETDYGLKVTWRRRKAVMRSLRERGHLSEGDTLIQKT